MGAPELLHHLRGAGLVLTLTPAGGLHVAPRTALTDDHRAAIRAERDALALALQAEAEQPPPPRRTGNPLMTPEQGDDCHAGGWDDAENDAFATREARFTRMGRTDAEYLAERLTLRDRQHDNRRMCLECRDLKISGHRAAVGRGEIRGTDPGVAPVPDTLRHCEAFRSPTPLLPSLER
jgi:hypothetical protein